MKLDETVDFYIKSVWHSLTRMYNRLAIEHGITQSIGYVLIHIEKEGTPSTKIATLMGMESTSLSRLLKNIEKMGLIYKSIDKTDKRIIRVFLTEEGIEKRKLAKQTVLTFNEKLSEYIDIKEIAKLNDLLKKVRECIQNEDNVNDNT